MKMGKLDANSKCAVDFETFSKVLNRPGGFRDPGKAEDYIATFQLFDKDNTEIIGLGEMRYVLTTLGEKLTDQEFDDLLKATGLDVSSGKVKYTGRFSTSHERLL
jgi:Ca2+-binding EF-hand superfamily protein